jgi:hypothetical protein
VYQGLVMSGAVLLALAPAIVLGVAVVVVVPVEVPSPELVVELEGLDVSGCVLAPVPRSTTTSGLVLLLELDEVLSVTVDLADSAALVAVSLTAAVAFWTAGMPAISRNFASICV